MFLNNFINAIIVTIIYHIRVRIPLTSTGRGMNHTLFSKMMQLVRGILSGDCWRFPAESYIAQHIEFARLSWYNTNISSEAYHGADQRVQVSSISG